MRNTEAYSNLIYLIVRNGKKNEHREMCKDDFDAIDLVIESLGPKKSFIVKSWFSLNREKKLKLRELAATFQISTSYTSELKDIAIDNLREESKAFVFRRLFE